MSDGSSTPGPLAGLKVLELGQLIAGPFAGRMMADFGADVIKVEPPARSDIVIENFRPGGLEKWGLGDEALARENPGLVLVRLSGYGRSGSYRDRSGFGAIAESMGGLRHVTGFPDRPSVRPNLSLGYDEAAIERVWAEQVI